MMKKNPINTISVIVPLYHGKGYVGQILGQIEKNNACIHDTELQLLLYNDCPSETIEIDNTEYSFGIKVINADKNAGIHGARVNALKQAVGKYILFLDQDDEIREHYLESQRRTIGDADAIVCRLINGKRLHYTDTFRFEEVITKEFMLKNWCPIVSPGQVLIRKEAIPNIWRKNILVDNGADDYFLWLCMMAEGKRFALNQDVLFEHVITGLNTSENTNQMMDSEEEMLRILERENVFPDCDVKVFDDLKRSLRRIHVKQLDTQRRALACLDRINRSFRERGGMYDWMRENRGRKVAVYGAGELGFALYDLLKEQGLVPFCYLDRNAEYIMADIPTYTMENMEVKLDSILLTIPDKDLEKELKQKFSCEVVNVEEIR